MARPGGYRVLIAGASSLQGKDLAMVLRERDFPAVSTELMDAPAVADAGGTRPADAMQLLDLEDEAGLLHPWDAARTADADVVFLCGDPDAARAAMRDGAAALTIDLTAGTAGATSPLLLSLDRPAAGHTEMAAGHAGLAVVAHPAAQTLARLAALGARAGAIDSLVATVFEPVSERGFAAVQELEQQTVSLLSARSLPTRIFDAQVAFTLRADLGTQARPRLEEVRQRIAGELARLLQAHPPPHPVGGTAVQLLQAPQFHGTIISAFLRYRHPPASAAVEAAFEHADLRRYQEAEGYPDSMAAAGEDALQLGPLRADAGIAGGYWLFAVCDNLRRTALTAVEGARALLEERAP